RISLPTVLLQENIARIKVPWEVCPNCPQPEWITAIAIDPLTGVVLGRGLIDQKGDGEIDLGDFRGKNVLVRVASPDGSTQQAAAIETDGDGDGIPDSRDNCVAVPNKSQTDTDG